MKHTLITLLALLATAASHAVEIIPLQMGEVFTLTNNGTQIWAITPGSTGVMKIVGDNGDGEWIGSCLNVFDAPDMKKEVQNYNWLYYEVNVKAGHTYYIKNTNAFGMDFRGHCVMAEEFKYTGCSPAEGTPFHIIGDTEAHFFFTAKAVTFTDGELECNGQRTGIYNFVNQNELIQQGIFSYTEIGTSGVVSYNGNVVGRANNDGIVIPLITSDGHGYTNILYQWTTDGLIEKGQTITMRLHGITNVITGELLGGTGELEAHWTVADLPTTLVSTTLPETFLSYWLPEDNDGRAVFQFSHDIASAQARIGMGYADADDRYEGDMPVSIDGNRVIVDFTGTVRNASTLSLTTTYPQMEVMLFNVIDANGNGTFSGDQGSASSYTYYLHYRDVSAEVSYEITPDRGSLATVDEIEIWYQDTYGVIEADGVEFTYSDDTDTPRTLFIAKDDAALTWTTDADGTTITVPVPAEVRSGKNVTLRLHIAKSLDGREHEIAAHYNLDENAIRDIIGCRDSDQTAYNLSGQRVSRPARGLYIIGSRKAVVK